MNSSSDCTILHVDADGFFAGVEQALTPALRGRPVVTGAERGIIAAASYEAKDLGIKRGLQLHEARAIYPDLAVLPSDYETCSLYSRHLFSILRRFTPHVEEYSIDEAFADLHGCGKLMDCPLERVAEKLRDAVRTEMGLTVSVGVSLTKTLAKLCSKFRKPDGQTVLRREHLPVMLRRTPVGKVWGIGPSATAKLTARGVKTAHDFTLMEAASVLKLLHKPGYETWLELQGRKVFKLELVPKTGYASMMKGHTFAPPSADRHLVFSEAMKNMAAALAKLRRHRHLAREIGLCLRLRDYSARAAAAALPALTAHDREAAPLLRRLFGELFLPGCDCRSTLVWLGGLVPEQNMQMDLFTDTPPRRLLGRLDRAVDRLNLRYGQGAVAHAALLDLQRKPRHPRDAAPERLALAPATARRRLAIPRMTLSNPV
ncbi:MAG: DNA polymerase IV [Kiritimatiellae bacterium]|nr:DNA polymerase IV [Kiritimatiellia bacterium]